MTDTIQFIVGKEYRRSELHDQYGGSRRGGISPSAKSPIVLLFTGESGKQYGYQDNFQEDGTFWYTGEGRVGDMKMTKGNLAIQNSEQDGRQLHLFEETRDAYVRYLGEFSYLSHHWAVRPDENEDPRKAIIFELEPIVTNTGSVPERLELPSQPRVQRLWKLSLSELRILATSSVPKEIPAAERKRLVYERSEAVRIYVLQRANAKCEGCGSPAPFETQKGRPYLEPHHIIRRADKGPDHPELVAALCPNCHRRVHFGTDGNSYNKTIAEKVQLRELELNKNAHAAPTPDDAKAS